MSVCCECCVLSGRGLCDELITRPEESYRLCCVVVCDLETSRMRRSWHALGRSATGKKTDKNSRMIGDYCILKYLKRSSLSLFWCTVPEFISKHWVYHEKPQSVYAVCRQSLEPSITFPIQARSDTVWLPHNPCKPYIFPSRRSPQIPLGSPEIEHVTTLQCFNPLMRLKANKSAGNWSAWNKGAFSVVAKII